MSHSIDAVRRPPVLLVVLLLVAVAAGCGSSDSSSTETSVSTTSVPTSSTAGSSGTTTTSTKAGVVVELTIAGGKVTGGVSRYDVKLGETVVFRVTSDVAEELHVHGYDHKLELTPRTPAELRFTADIPGVFEVELEHSGLKVAELQVA